MKKSILLAFWIVTLTSGLAQAAELRFEGLKNPGEKDAAKQGSCSAIVITDDKGAVLSLEGRINDPKAKHPKDRMWDENKRNHGKWEIKTTDSGQLKQIKVSNKISGSLHSNVLEVKKLDKPGSIELRISRVFGLIDDVFGIPFTQTCKNLKLVSQPTATPQPAGGASEQQPSASGAGSAE